ncbi:MAG TPA: enoyl-CoA hydratase/isomerase family protein [Spirochaetota bacterium]|nr:enoyl-CoA hydratase/isomerase family protein [Spirochaetota bacterium]HPJ36520.1 enoyl-CoA hydratase/isomerase family protein [Spirochaetota bacterium]
MEYKTIEFTTPEKGIMVLSLNRPDVYNSVSQLMMEELEHFWRERLYDLETRVVILKGNGEKGFCAGLDMKETAEMSGKFNVEELYRFQARLARVNLHMRRAPQPIIAAVHGAAAGQGFSFVLASDIRVISPDAKFCAAYINIGLGGADMSCSYFLPRMIGAGRAYEFMYTGRFMKSDEAMNLGLVSKMVDKDKIYDEAMEYAKILMSKNPMALRLTKEAINMNLDAGGMEQALNMEDRNQTLLAMGAALQMNKVKQ